MTPERILLVGGSGQLGTALRAALADRRVDAPAHGELAFEDEAAFGRRLDASAPDAVVNCAAFHQVDACESRPDVAFAVNATAVDAAAKRCAERGITFVTISTDYVFDGTLGRAYRERDAINPRTAYGVSKAAGELLARRHGPRHVIVRTSGVFAAAGLSSKGAATIERVLRQAERGEKTRMVDDVVFSPSYAPDVARGIRDLLDAGASGTHHVTNQGAASWFEFIRTAFERAGLPAALLEPISYAALGTDIARPMHSALENTTFAPLGIAPLPHWREAVDVFLAARSATHAGAGA